MRFREFYPIILRIQKTRLVLNISRPERIILRIDSAPVRPERER